ncbi:MAG TPA: hypothetical protein VKA84_22075 [Gemmatimonadaceae bacterium]|nr:hypothetical protein [Gemmatimonadaceae bacterium]
MPKSNQPQQPGALAGKADALFRSAAECVRQRERYARVVSHEAGDSEERAALRVVRLCDELLQECVAGYERLAAHGAGDTDGACWRAANMLWQASRDYVRRHDGCDRATRRLGGSTPATLGKLALDFDLEASALLALRQAVEAYRRVRPRAELTGPAAPTAPGAPANAA